jgi:MYXO-CTERM domain-containing protein
MMIRRITFTVATLLLVAMWAVPGAPAQDGGIMYFTADLLETDDVDPANQDVCVDPTYAMAPQPPAEAGSAYGANSIIATGCSTLFSYTAESAFALSGDATVHLYVSCDAVSVSFPAGISTYRAFLRQNGEEIAQTTVFGGSGPCVSGEVEEQSITVSTEDTAFAPGDVLTVQILWWRANTPPGPAQNMYYLVGGDSPSALLAAGLPAGAAPAGAAAIALDAAETATSAAPGSDAAFTVTIQNEGDDDSEVTLALEGLPDGFAGSFMPSELTVAAGNASDANLTIAIPPDATAGSYDFAVVATAAEGTNATLNLTLEVTEADANPSPGSSPRPSFGASPTDTPDDSASPSSDADNGTAQNGTAEASPGAGSVAALSAVAVGLLALLARRRRNL